MISKKLFCDTLARMEILQQTEDFVNKAFQDIGSDFNQFSYDDALVLVLELLIEGMHDENNGWITYFVFDLDYGKEYGTDVHLTPKAEFGDIIPMHNAEELYEYLVDQATDKGFI